VRRLAVLRAALLVLAVACAADCVLLIAVGRLSDAPVIAALLVACLAVRRMHRPAMPAPCPVPPLNVRIEHADGSSTPCAVILDPESYPDGITRWYAMPPPGFVLTRASGDVLAGVIPPRTRVTLSVTVRAAPGGEAGADGCGS
jgi:hypothetical protein